MSEENRYNLNQLVRFKAAAQDLLVQKVVHDTNNFYGVIQGYVSLMEMTVTDPQLKDKFVPPMLEALQAGIDFNKHLGCLYRKAQPLRVAMNPGEVAREVFIEFDGSEGYQVSVKGHTDELLLDTETYRTVIRNLCLLLRQNGSPDAHLRFDRATLTEQTATDFVYSSNPGEYLTLSTELSIKNNTGDITGFLNPFAVSGDPQNDPGLATLLPFIKNHGGNLDLRLQGTTLTMVIYLPMEYEG
ncbi:MAG: hypothetical protein KAU50_09275 [Candidatus Marinimicrobia bacterium]|nr:hypothetical protein [Candidatus Neomarinimicrobiota bacterium]